MSRIVLTGLAIQLLTLASGPLVARMLGPSGRGVMAMVVLFATLGAQFGISAVAVAISHQVAEAGGGARARLRGSLPRWIAWATVPAVLAGLAFALTVDTGTHRLLLSVLTAIVTLVACWSNLYVSMLRGEVAIQRLNRIQLLAALVYASIVVALFVAPLPGQVWLVVLAYLTSIAFTTVAARLSLQPVPPDPVEAIPMKRVHALARRVLVSSIGPLTLGLDYLVIGVLATPAQLGLYAVAASVSTLPGIALTSVAGMLLPRLASVTGAARTSLLRRWVGGAFAVAVTIVLGMEVIIEPFIRILFGTAFLDSIPVARLMIVAMALLAFRTVLAAAAQAQGRAAVTSAIEFAGAAMLVPLVAVGVTHSGITGAAAALIAIASAICVAFASLIRWRETEVDGAADTSERSA